MIGKSPGQWNRKLMRKEETETNDQNGTKKND
jgi:hypothetical protein